MGHNTWTNNCSKAHTKKNKLLIHLIIFNLASCAIPSDVSNLKYDLTYETTSEKNEKKKLEFLISRKSIHKVLQCEYIGNIKWHWMYFWLKTSVICPLRANVTLTVSFKLQTMQWQRVTFLHFDIKCHFFKRCYLCKCQKLSIY